MKEKLLWPIVGLCFGLLAGGVLVWAIHWGNVAAEQRGGEQGRFQIYGFKHPVMSSPTKGPDGSWSTGLSNSTDVFRIDTNTGQTWVYNETYIYNEKLLKGFDIKSWDSIDEPKPH